MIERLEPFVGEWRVETSLGDVRAVTTFEWALGGAFLLQRSEIDLPEAPDGLCLIGAAGDDFTQYYFDSRGVVRTYAMTFDGRTWTLRARSRRSRPRHGSSDSPASSRATGSWGAGRRPNAARPSSPWTSR
jgi:hypothetical protein